MAPPTSGVNGTFNERHHKLQSSKLRMAPPANSGPAIPTQSDCMLTRLRVESDSQMDGDVGVAAVLTLALEMFLDETARVMALLLLVFVHRDCEAAKEMQFRGCACEWREGADTGGGDEDWL